jgi:hypothetical protein
VEAALLNAVFAYIDGLEILPTYYPNVGGNPTAEHIRVSVLPTAPQKISLCGSGSRHTWIVQCGVYVRAGVGMIKAAEYIDQLRAAMPYRAEIGDGFFVSTDGEAMPPIAVDGWFFIPVQFRLQKVI